MPYFAVFETATGRLVSLGSVLANPLDASLSAVDLGSKPADSLMWSDASRTFVARPAKVLVDRLQDLLDYYPDFLTVWNSLTTQRKNLIRTALIQFLGSKRFRNANGGVALSDD